MNTVRCRSCGSICSGSIVPDTCEKCDPEVGKIVRKAVMKQPSAMDIMFNPEKYGYKVCTHCNGYGSSLKEKADKCTKCGGSGLTKK